MIGSKDLRVMDLEGLTKRLLTEGTLAAWSKVVAYDSRVIFEPLSKEEYADRVWWAIRNGLLDRDDDYDVLDNRRAEALSHGEFVNSVPSVVRESVTGELVEINLHDVARRLKSMQDCWGWSQTRPSKVMYGLEDFVDFVSKVKNGLFPGESQSAEEHAALSKLIEPYSQHRWPKPDPAMTRAEFYKRWAHLSPWEE